LIVVFTVIIISSPVTFPIELFKEIRRLFSKKDKDLSNDDDPIIKTTEPFTQHDACDDCGKRTDGLTTCTYPSDGGTTKLCPDCMENSGFCLICGQFCSGMSSFDFSEMPGYCSDCVDEIKEDMDKDEDYDRNDY
jgi:hypothetical protein